MVFTFGPKARKFTVPSYRKELYPRRRENEGTAAAAAAAVAGGMGERVEEGGERISEVGYTAMGGEGEEGGANEHEKLFE